MTLWLRLRTGLCGLRRRGRWWRGWLRSGLSWRRSRLRRRGRSRGRRRSYLGSWTRFFFRRFGGRRSSFRGLFCFCRFIDDSRARSRRLNRSSCCLRRRCFGQRRLDSATATTNRRRICGGLNNRSRSLNYRRSGSPTTARRSSCGCCCTRALLTLPSRPNSRDLIICQGADVTAHRHIHLPQKRDDFLDRNAEFASQVVNAKFAQERSPLKTAISRQLSAIDC